MITLLMYCYIQTTTPFGESTIRKGMFQPEFIADVIRTEINLGNMLSIDCHPVKK